MDAPRKVKLVNINNIVVDHNLQSRVAIDKETAREFSEAMRRGDQFPPVDVFFDGTSYLLADGFHRINAYHHVGRRDVRCNVHDGDRRDARIFSAGSNRQFSVKRTTGDIRKSIRMLLEDDDWFLRNNSQIALHVGCATQTVKRVRYDFCRERKIEPPHEFENATGNILPATRHFNLATRPTYAEEKRMSSLPERYSLEYSYIRDLFYKFGFKSVVEHGMGSRYPGIRAIQHAERGIVATSCDFLLADALPLAVGRVLLARQIVDRPRMIILGYARDKGTPQETIAHAGELGIEFVTPEALIAEMKG